MVHTKNRRNHLWSPTWWFIPLGKWLITPVASVLTLLIPHEPGIFHVLRIRGMSHQAGLELTHSHLHSLRTFPAPKRKKPWCLVQREHLHVFLVKAFGHGLASHGSQASPSMCRYTLSACVSKDWSCFFNQM